MTAHPCLIEQNQRSNLIKEKGDVFIERTISFETGKGSLSHNSRQFIAANVDKERTPLNQEYCKESIKKVYHKLFDEALQKYNDKQTRKDRIIPNYYEHIRTGHQEKPFTEIVVQIGNIDDTHCGTEEADLAAKILDEYYRDFRKRNPNLYVFSAHMHLDESTPHLHIDFVPFTTNSKKGLETRVSLKQALASQGFIGTGKGDTEWNRWAVAEKIEISKVMEKYDMRWLQKGTHNQHLSVLDYKKQERTKEVEKLDKTISEKQVEFKTLKQRVLNYEEATVKIEKIESKLQTDPEYQLPEPTALMTAKSFRQKIVIPLIEKLKKLIRTLVAECFRAWDNYYRLNETNGNLYNENSRLRDKIEILLRDNDRLKKENKDYSFLRRIFGQPKMDALMNQAKKIQKEKQQTSVPICKKNYNRDER